MEFNVAHGGHGTLPIHIAAIHTKHSPRKYSSEIIDKFKGGKLVRVNLSDRVLYIAQGICMEKLLAKKGSFDEYLILDPFHNQESCDLLNIKYYMGNFTGDRRLTTTSLRVIWDSGGLQISRGVRDFIDPKAIGIGLKENEVYAGVTLDLIPILGMAKYSKAIRIASKLQKMNTERIKKYSGKSKILDVVHGYNQDDRKVWFNNVAISKNEFWCLSDFNRLPSITDRALLLCDDIKKLRENVDIKKIWVHVLGMATHKFVLIMLPIALNVKEMTSDATSALMCANNAIMLLPPVNTIFPQISVRQLSDSGVGIPPCSCPVCRIIKDPWVYAQFNIPLAYHNIAVINSTVQHMVDILNHSGIEEYIKFLKRYNTPHSIIHIITQSIEYLNGSKDLALGSLNSVHNSIGESFCFSTPPNEKALWETFDRYIKFYKSI